MKAEQPAELKRLQHCPFCNAKVNVTRFADGKEIACGSCSNHFTVGKNLANLAGAEKSMLLKPVDSVPGQEITAPMPDPVFDHAPLFDSLPPAPASVSSPHASMPNSVKPLANPYSTPRQRSNHAPQRGGHTNEINYIVPGIFVAGWGGVSVLICLLRILTIINLSIKVGLGNVKAYELGALIGGVVIGMFISITMLLGRVNMVRQKGFSTARSAAVLAAIPCFGCFVFPFGIWACVSLFSRQAEADFR